MRAINAIFSNLFLGRFLIALAAVFAAYNSLGYSYYHWVAAGPFEGFSSPTGLGKILVGGLLLLLLVAMIWSSWRAPAKVVYLGIVALLIVGLLMMNSLGWINLKDPDIGVIIAQVLVAFTLALGSIWSHVWFKRTGQRAVEDFDTNEA